MPMSASVAAESLPLEGNGLTLDDRPHLHQTKAAVTQYLDGSRLPGCTWMRPLRAHSRFVYGWIGGLPTAFTDDTVTVRMIVTDDDGTHRSVEHDFPRPPKLKLPDLVAPPLTAEFVRARLDDPDPARRRLVLLDPAGDRTDAELVDLDEAHVLIRNVRTGRLSLPRLADRRPERVEIHQIRYAAGGYDRGAFFYQAWCSCRAWSFNDVDEQARRWAVASHLTRVGAGRPRPHVETTTA